MNFLNTTIKNRTTEFLSNYGLAIVFILFLILDGFGKAHIFNNSSTIIPLAIKGFISVLSVFIIIFTTSQKKSLLPFILLGICFVIGQWTLDIPFSINNLIIFGKFITPLLLIFIFNKVTRNLKSSERLFKLFEWVLVVNSMLIFIGFLFKVKLFQSYMWFRFGYNGLFVTSGVSSFCTIIALAYFFFAYKQEVWKNYKFWILLVSSAFIGTKVVYIGMVLLLIAIVLQLNHKFKKHLALLIIIAFITAFYLAFFEFGLFAKITSEKGLLSSILSLRDELFLERTWPYIQDQWNWINYLFGGITDFSLRSQMEFIDVFFFWGILGGVIYLTSFGHYYFTFKLDKAQKLFFAFFIFILLLTGNFFLYSTIIIFLLVLRERIFYFESIKSTHDDF